MNNRTIHLQGIPKLSSVYVAGPMRGYTCYNFERFFFWSSILRQSGYVPINPAQMDCERMFDGWLYSDEKYEEVIAIDLDAIENKANAIFNLEGWEMSSGANRENEKALEVGIPVFCEVDYN